MANGENDIKTVIPAKCAACHDTLESPLFCGNCRKLYPADGLSCFDLLGLPPQYDLDLDALRRRYLKLMRDVHPDRMATGAESIQQMCLRVNAQINEAWDILKDSVTRAEYLLELCGGKSSAEDKQIPQEVLMEALETREAIDEARVDGDLQTLARIRDQLLDQYRTAAENIAAAARRLPGAEADRGRLRGMLNAIRYYRKMLESAEAGLPHPE